MKVSNTFCGQFDNATDLSGCSIVISNVALNEGSSKQGNAARAIVG